MEEEKGINGRDKKVRYGTGMVKGDGDEEGIDESLKGTGRKS